MTVANFAVKRLLPTLAISLSALTPVVAQAFAETPPPRVHDPSAIISDHGKAWIFSTGIGLRSHHSNDLEHWQSGPPVFNSPLPWFRDISPTQRGHLWAPDAIRIGKRFLLYYSVSAFGKQSSAIALTTTPTLDPESPNHRWTDQGVVIRSKRGDPFNAIDPCILLDKDKLWMAFGSFWDGIFLIELDPRTGKRNAPDTPPVRLASAPEIEAPFLHKRGDHYYLFVNWGLCCRGVKSTYEIRVGRAANVAGPYLDQDGTDLRDGGGSLVLGSRGSRVGPGHASIVRDLVGRENLAYHYYDADQNGRSFLALTPLQWSADGWPVIPQNSPKP